MGSISPSNWGPHFSATNLWLYFLTILQPKHVMKSHLNPKDPDFYLDSLKIAKHSSMPIPYIYVCLFVFAEIDSQKEKLTILKYWKSKQILDAPPQIQMCTKTKDPISHPFTEFSGNPSCSLCVTLPTNRQRNKHRWKARKSHSEWGQ